MPQVQPKQGIAQESRGQQLSTMALVIAKMAVWKRENGKRDFGDRSGMGLVSYGSKGVQSTGVLVIISWVRYIFIYNGAKVQGDFESMRVRHGDAF